jgi:hypothetical protein
MYRLGSWLQRAPSPWRGRFSSLKQSRSSTQCFLSSALFYLAFTAYFGVATAWRLELVAVAAFSALALVGMRLPSALIVAYPLHGVWDLLHELQAHGIHFGFDPGKLTAIPLAYGIFCAAFDFAMGAYFYTQRTDWSDAWKPVWQPHSAQSSTSEPRKTGQ